MWNRKRHKTIVDFSVSKLLDDFINPAVQPSDKSAREIDDEEYIRMMLKKDAQMKLERTKRESLAIKNRSKFDPHSDTIDEDVKQRFFPDVSEPLVEKKKQVEVEVSEKTLQEEGIVGEILDSIVVKDVSGLAARMKEAVDFVQEEMGASDAERRLSEALEDYCKSQQTERKKSEPHFYNDNILLLKRCQNCYFCVGERNRNGSVWCLCTNPSRCPEVEIDDSWVKSELNLPCWKAPED
jgi:hypothetical protein